MTTMLEKAVGGMAAELERQIAPQVAEHKAGKWGSAQSHFSGPSAVFGTCQVNGEVDLAALARAGLLAIREPDDRTLRASAAAFAEAHHPADGAADESVGAAISAYIDAILAEEPEKAA